MLGLPQTLSDDDIDQDFPTEVDDEFITEDGILATPAGHTSLIAAANHDFRLTEIVTKILRSVYPIKGFQDSDQEPSRGYKVSYRVIRDIEDDLQNWMESIPLIFRPGGEAPPRILR